MRQIGLALGTLALIVALSWSHTAALSRELAKIDTALAAAQADGRPETLQQAQTLWEAVKTRLYVTEPHQAADQVSGALARAAACLEQEKPQEARVELAVARDGVRVLLEREKLTLGNLF